MGSSVIKEHPSLSFDFAKVVCFFLFSLLHTLTDTPCKIPKSETKVVGFGIDPMF